MKSNKKSHLLTFELDKKSLELEIHVNKEGLEILQERIKLLLNSKSSDHTHLMSESWDGEELTNEKQSEQNELIQSVKILKWN